MFTGNVEAQPWYCWQTLMPGFSLAVRRPELDDYTPVPRGQTNVSVQSHLRSNVSCDM